LATGATTALGENLINKILRKGIPIPKRFIETLPMIKKVLTKAQIDQINRTYQTRGRLVIKATRNQIERGFLGTLASIGIPAEISLLT